MKKRELFLALILASFHGLAMSSEEMPMLYRQALKAAKQSLQQQPIPIVSSPVSYMRSLSKKANIEDSFHVINVCSLPNRMELWNQYLPQAGVHYALKTNHEKVVAAVMAALGAGFDCASRGEMEQVLNLGVSPDKIVFSHPRKPVVEIVFAEQHHIKKMMFDSIEELDKMRRYAPSGEYILRIKTHDEHSETPLSSKFGASLKSAYTILDYAFKKQANVIGISFHVGSNNLDAKAYTQAIADASLLFKYSQDKWNHPLRLLDLGGGWPGENDARFILFAKTVNHAIARYFPSKVEVIAEPGRYFATQTTTAATRVIGTQRLQTRQGSKFAYYLSNGVYGFFSASLYYQYDANKIALEGWSFHPLNPSADQKGEVYPSIFWGPTCDSGDKILDNILFPRMRVNDFIYADHVGSYTYTGQTAFNQITPSKAYYVCQLPTPSLKG